MVHQEISGSNLIHVILFFFLPNNLSKIQMILVLRSRDLPSLKFMQLAFPQNSLELHIMTLQFLEKYLHLEFLQCTLKVWGIIPFCNHFNPTQKHCPKNPRPSIKSYFLQFIESKSTKSLHLNFENLNFIWRSREFHCILYTNICTTYICNTCLEENFLRNHL